MLESGKRKPSLDTLEKIAAALGIPFHLFTLLASEAEDVRNADPKTVQRLAAGLAKLLLTGEEDEDDGGRAGGRKAPDFERQSARRQTEGSKEKLVSLASTPVQNYSPFEL